MIVLRGKLKGQRVTPHQYANDWITIKETSAVLSPGSVELEEADLPLFDSTSLGKGTFWLEWELGEDRRFRPRSRPARGGLQPGPDGGGG